MEDQSKTPSTIPYMVALISIIVGWIGAFIVLSGISTIGTWFVIFGAAGIILAIILVKLKRVENYEQEDQQEGDS